MTTPPPPPPPGSSEWPSSQPSQPSQPWPASQPASQPAATGSDGRQPWWSGGRILLAIVIVLVLMGGSAVVGFIAGTTWGTFDTIAGDFDFDEDGFPFDGEVPGLVSPDAPADEGDPLRFGAQVSGVVAERPVEHVLTVESSRDVELEITDADFDTVLVLLDSSGEVIDANDDGGSGTNSAVTASLSAGTYLVRVQPFSEGFGGDYTLAVD